MEVPEFKKNLEMDLREALDNYVRENAIHGATLSIQGEPGKDFNWHGASGNLDISSPYFLIEVTELFITAIILKLRVRGQLKLEDRLTRFLPEHETLSLAKWRDPESIKKITLRSLLSHCSGIPDILEVTSKTSPSVWPELALGNDQAWSTANELKKLTQARPHFAPGEGTKANYSFTNFFLLVRIIEHIEGKMFGDVVQEFHYRPLGLSQTYIYDNHLDRTPSFFQNAQGTLHIPLGMSCFGAYGGMVSTAKDCMAFLRAFFHGHLFPSEYLMELQEWTPASKGLFHGLGLRKFETAGVARLFKKTEPPIVGVVGRSGAFALYHTGKRLFFTGTTNVLNGNTQAIRLVHTLSKLLP